MNRKPKKSALAIKTIVLPQTFCAHIFIYSQHIEYAILHIHNTNSTGVNCTYKRMCVINSGCVGITLIQQCTYLTSSPCSALYNLYTFGYHALLALMLFDWKHYCCDYIDTCVMYVC